MNDINNITSYMTLKNHLDDDISYIKKYWVTISNINSNDIKYY